MAKNRWRLVIVLLLVSLLLTACNSRLPGEAKRALDERTKTTTEVVSAKQAKEPSWMGRIVNRYDEAWCVITKSPHKAFPAYQASTHFILVRQQLLWDVYMLGYENVTQKEFLIAGCDNW